MYARTAIWTLLSLAFGLTGCVAHSKVSVPASNISGNWHIVGAHSMSQFPLVAFAVGVSGNTVYGNGDIGVNCSQGSSALGASAIAASVAVTGQVASDGSFQMSNAAEPSDTIQISIEGTLPKDGATTWNGHFTLANAASQTGCLFSYSEDFTATSYSPLTGTYSGTITGPKLTSGLNITISVSQGQPTISTNVPLSNLGVTIPLSGSVNVTGSSCYSSTTAAAAAASSIAGDGFGLIFPMDDGSTLTVQGWFADPTESTWQVQTTHTAMGACSVEAGSGTLTRQP